MDWVKVEFKESLPYRRKKPVRAVSDPRESSNGMRRVCSPGLSVGVSKSSRQFAACTVWLSVICGPGTLTCACLPPSTYGQSSRHVIRAIPVSRPSEQWPRPPDASSGTPGKRCGRLVRYAMYHSPVCVSSSEPCPLFCSGFSGRCQLVIIVTSGCSSYGPSSVFARSTTTACS
ncbi:hypothetical protein D3C76_1089040 [compost metagenome]